MTTLLRYEAYKTLYTAFVVAHIKCISCSQLIYRCRREACSCQYILLARILTLLNSLATAGGKRAAAAACPAATARRLCADP